jgi:hypothetical protein
MSGEPGLASLLYRADWTRLSLTAEAGSRWTVICPGAVSSPVRRGPDTSGEWPPTCWAPRRAGQATGGPEPPLAHMLRPSWLLTGFTLEPGEPASVDGRDGLRVVATPRPPGGWDSVDDSAPRSTPTGPARAAGQHPARGGQPHRPAGGQGRAISRPERSRRHPGRGQALRPALKRYLRMLTARATTRAMVTIEMEACAVMPIFAQRDSGMVSVGLKAAALVNDRYR